MLLLILPYNDNKGFFTYSVTVLGLYYVFYNVLAYENATRQNVHEIFYSSRYYYFKE